MKKYLLIVYLFLFTPFAAFGASGNFGLDKAADAAKLPTGTVDIKVTIAKYVSIALEMVGVVFLILFIYGGFMWMFSKGDSGKVGDAKKILVNAVIGLVIIFSAYVITSFVMTSVAGLGT